MEKKYRTAKNCTEIRNSVTSFCENMGKNKTINIKHIFFEKVRNIFPRIRIKKFMKAGNT